MAEASDVKASLPEAEKKKEQSLPFYQLFSFADKYDWILMISGSIGAIIHGSSMPVFFLLFGQMVNGFGKNQMDLKKMTDEVSKVNIIQNSQNTNLSLRSVFLKLLIFFVLLMIIIVVCTLLCVPWPCCLYIILCRYVFFFFFSSHVSSSCIKINYCMVHIFCHTLIIKLLIVFKKIIIIFC